MSLKSRQQSFEGEGEYVMVVDKNDQIVGEKPIGIVHKLGIYHRAVWVYIINQMEEMLFIKRSSALFTCPGVWTVPGEHVAFIETYQETAQRCMQEELGIDIPLDNWFHIAGPEFLVYNYTNGDGARLDNCFFDMWGSYYNGTDFKLDTTENTEWGYFSELSLVKWYQQAPQDFCSRQMEYIITEVFNKLKHQ